MPLESCRECRQEISTDASFCHHCGAPWPTKPGWRGPGFEWSSSRTLYGYPLIHIAFGKDAQGKRKVAKGFIAIGQFAFGVITVAQFWVGLLFGFGQFIVGLTALAPFAGAILMGVGQFASGYAAIGQIVLAKIGLAQLGLADFLWSPNRRDPEAVEFFNSLWDNLRQLLSWYTAAPPTTGPLNLVSINKYYMAFLPVGDNSRRWQDIERSYLSENHEKGDWLEF